MGFSIGPFLDEGARTKHPELGESVLYKNLQFFQGQTVGLDLAHLVRCLGYKVIVSNPKMTEIQQNLLMEQLSFEEMKQLEDEMEKLYQEERELMPGLLSRYVQFLCVLLSFRIYPVIVLDGVTPRHKKEEKKARQETKKRQMDSLEEEKQKHKNLKLDIEDLVEKKDQDEDELTLRMKESIELKNRLFCLEDKFFYPTEAIYTNLIQVSQILCLPVLNKQDKNFRYEADSILAKLYKEKVTTAGAIANDHDIALYGCPILAGCYAEVRSILDYFKVSLSDQEKGVDPLHNQLTKGFLQIQQKRVSSLQISRSNKHQSQNERAISGWIRHISPSDLSLYLGLSMGEEMAWLSNLMGNDLCQGGLKKVGAKTAIQFIQSKRSSSHGLGQEMEGYVSAHFKEQFNKWWKETQEKFQALFEKSKSLVCVCDLRPDSCLFEKHVEDLDLWKDFVSVFSFLTKEEKQVVLEDPVQKCLVIGLTQTLVCPSKDQKKSFEAQECIFNWAREKATLYFLSQKRHFMAQANRNLSLSSTFVCDCGCWVPSKYSDILVSDCSVFQLASLEEFWAGHHLYSGLFSLENIKELFEKLVSQDPLFVELWSKFR